MTNMERMQKSEPTLASLIASQLRDLIVNGKMQPGTKVNIDSIRSQLDVSLSPLREALSRLSSEGYLTFQDKRGYRVSEVSETDLHQIIFLRVDLESAALRLAIQMADPDWEKDVMRKLDILVNTKRDLADPHSVERWETAHLDFHTELLSTCGMPLLLQFTTRLHYLNDRYRRLFLASQSVPRDTKTEHIRIAEAAVARNVEEAVSELRAHIEGTGSQIRRALPRMLRQSAWDMPKVSVGQ